MDHLHQALGAKVREWREREYPCDEFPAITKILDYRVQSEEVSDDAHVDTLRFLRTDMLGEEALITKELGSAID